MISKTRNRPNVIKLSVARCLSSVGCVGFITELRLRATASSTLSFLNLMTLEPSPVFIAKEIGAPTLANMVMVGKVIKETALVNYDDLEAGLKKVVSARHADLLEVNKKAIAAGYDFT